MTNAHQAYAIYCDGNALKRIDASHEEHIRNLEQMLSDVLRLTRRHRAAIDNRCPSCGGSGQRVSNCDMDTER